MRKLFGVLLIAVLLTACGNSPEELSTSTPEITPTEAAAIEITPNPETDVRTEIYASSESKAKGLTEVASFDCRLISKESFETVSLHTSATKQNGRFIWDDHAKWVLEISSDTGAIYTLYDTEVSNGSIYFDILEVDGIKYILLRNISTAANYTKTFTFDGGKLYETNELDLNGLKDKAINLIFTSTPTYR